jgi:hypothetical protein
MGAFDLIAKAAAKKAKKAGPFFSKADVILDELQRGKGTGDEFLTELVKKGVKPTELKDRGLDKALKGKPKMTKAEVQQVFKEKAPPRVRDEVRGGYEYQRALDEKAQEMIGDEDVGFDDLYGRDKDMAEAAVRQEYGYDPETKYGEYVTPGGTNYREILLKIPQRGLNEIDKRNLMLYEGDIRRGKELDPWHQKKYEALKEKEAAGSQDYQSVHFKDTPNILAHIRVQDFTTPEGKKVLLVDEVQSDWHQKGRKGGYYTQEQREAAKQAMKEWKLKNQGALFTGPDQFAKEYPEYAWMNNAAPDAPFKKNWHELAMKRVLDYAAENGYDSIAITPGAEQAKRYDLSKQVSEISVGLMGDQRMVKIKDSSGKTIDSLMVGPDGMVSESDIGVAGKALDDVVGKELASKITSLNEPQVLRGIDLQVGGEGMKGFYDKIMPDYLNNYGKKYGAQTGQIQLQTGQEMGRGATGSDMIPSYSPTMQSFHSFDITPQMREEITTKGQPMYGKVAMPALEGLAAGTGAATIGSEVFDTNNEQQVQNPVHFTENPDAMLLELMQRN